MSRARYLVGDVFDRLAEIPDGSVDLVMTSPPFLKLRSYLPAGHPNKAKEIGQEPSPAEFIDTMLALSAEWRRVLAPHGSIAVELGDTYAGGGQGPDAKYAAKADSVLYNPTKRGTHSAGGWPLAKSMVGIPHLYHLSLAYGRNLLTGAESPAGQWRVRNVVAWVRPNPPVGALGDKFRPATSYLTIACVSQRRYFDLDAVRGGAENVKDQRQRTTNGAKQGADRSEVLTANYSERVPSHPGGAPPLDWWEIPTQPYSGSHYATFPEALVVRPVEAMCPRRVCTVCGKPSERIVGDAEYVQSRNGGTPATLDMREGQIAAEGVRNWSANGATSGDNGVTRVAPTLGWTDCECSDDGSHWRPGLVLDPFAGSGTTLAVATARGRDAIGIDLDARNLDLARERIGMWLEEDAA